MLCYIENLIKTRENKAKICSQTLVYKNFQVLFVHTNHFCKELEMINGVLLLRRDLVESPSMLNPGN